MLRSKKYMLCAPLAAVVMFAGCDEPGSPGDDNEPLDTAQETTEAEEDPSETFVVPEFVRTNQAEDRTNGLLVRVYTSEYHVVEFYQDSIGGMFVSEAGVAGEPSLNLPAEMSALSVYQLLDPDGAVPEVLRAAEERFVSCADESDAGGTCEASSSSIEPLTVRLRHSVAPFPALEEPTSLATPSMESSEQSGSAEVASRKTVVNDGRVSARSGGCSVAAWNSTISCPGWGNHQWYHEWWTGTFWADGDNVEHDWMNVCVDHGTITLTRSGNGGSGNWTVPEGTWRTSWNSFSLSCCCFPFCACYCDHDVFFEVINASGDWFHTCGNFDW